MKKHLKNDFFALYSVQCVPEKEENFLALREKTH